MKKLKTILFLFSIYLTIETVFEWNSLFAQTAMINVSGRKTMSLNGKWNAIIDPIEKGDWLKVWEERKPENKTDFVEYSFEGSPVLNVPGDFNTQLPELTYYEGSIWYQKSFNYNIKKNKCLFVHFGAINYLATVYLNGKLLGKHEGDLLHFNLKLLMV